MKRMSRKSATVLYDVAPGPTILLALGIPIAIVIIVAVIVAVTVILVVHAKNKKKRLANPAPGAPNYRPVPPNYQPNAQSGSTAGNPPPAQPTPGKNPENPDQNG